MPSARNTEAKICQAALKLAAREGWRNLGLEQIARAAKVPPAQVKKTFSNTNDILPAIVRLTDDEVAATVSKPDRNGKLRDRLFEILMARFDSLQKNRGGILAIAADARHEARIAVSILQAQWRSMQKTARLSGMRLDDMRRPLAVLGLMGVYQFALCVWLKDETKDMSKTMAALDRGLRGAAFLGEILFRH